MIFITRYILKKNSIYNKKKMFIISSALIIISFIGVNFIKESATAFFKIATALEIDMANPMSIIPFSNIDIPKVEKKNIKKGIDVSKYQGKIDWNLVSNDNIEFAMIRLGFRGYETGKVKYDEYFENNMQGALNNNIEVGCYFSSTAITKKEIEEEVNIILKSIKEYNVTMPIAIAWRQERTPESRAFNVTQEDATNLIYYFCRLVKEAGYEPLIYGDQKWFDDFSYNLKYSIWVGYYDKRGKVNINKIKMWQYTNTGKIQGITTNIDINYYFSD